MPLVSFVIPCYNYGRYLRDCLDGIFSQNAQYDFEIIAVNDGSQDNTIEILKSYDDSRLKIIDRHQNRGHIFTVNEGLQAATGKYVCRIDPDDRHRPNFLSRTVPILDQYPEVGLVYGNINLIDSAGRVTVERGTMHPRLDFKGNEFIELLKRNYICAPTVLARREAWMSAYPVPNGLAFNDWYFSIMLARKWEYYYISDVLADYRVHDSNWHNKVSRDGSEERSVLWLLDWVYSREEESTELESRKQRAKKEVYSAQYLDFATKYFGHAMFKESRRCFMKAIALRPQLMLRSQVAKHFIGAIFPKPYRLAREGIKKIRGITR